MNDRQRDKRRRIMGRSMALGHCICDARKPCPCDVFRREDICECAGERAPVGAGPVRLTEHVRKTGCASKVPKADLERALAGLPMVNDPRVLVGRSAGDDAGVIRVGEGDPLILTVDVFAPSVDDPFTFGQVAAANSLSDIYAMGGRPESALSVIGFPVHELPLDAMREILRGGCEKMAEAGIDVIGGHSIDDNEVKFGFAVVGTAPGGVFMRNVGAREGDAVILTKPLGTGMLAFAGQIGRASEDELARAAASMTELNRRASELMMELGARAATDVTGFGLLGHLWPVARESGVAIEIDFDRLPLLPGVERLARQGVLPGGIERNLEALEGARVDLGALSEAQRAVTLCPETSGGLLVFLPEAKAEEYVRAFGAPAAIIGRVTGVAEGGAVRAAGSERWEAASLAPGSSGTARAPAPASECCVEPTASVPVKDVAECCAPGSPAVSRSGLPPLLPEVARAFGAYSAAVNAEGALDTRTKKLISLALSVLSKCEPCVTMQAEAARKAGASERELAEAVALGISFGGAPANMFYRTLRGGG